MKNYLFFLFYFLFFYLNIFSKNLPLDFIEKYQNKIYGCELIYYQDRNMECFNKKLDSLINFKNEFDNNVYNYWKYYTIMKLARYYGLNNEPNKIGDKLIIAIGELEKKQNKDLEEEILLIRLKMLEANNDSKISAMLKFSGLKKDFENLLKKYKENLRLFNTGALLDYYTPTELGGGKLVEEYLNRSLDKSEFNTSYIAKPSWGLEETYLLFVDFYLLKKNNQILAKDFYFQGIKSFPTGIIKLRFKRNFE